MDSMAKRPFVVLLLAIEWHVFCRSMRVDSALEGGGGKRQAAG
jgi:hypothetical protein